MVAVSPSSQSTSRQALRSLRRRWLLFAMAGALSLGGMYGLLAGAGLPAGLYLVPSAPAFGLLLHLFWKALPDNRRADEKRLLPRLGPGNWMTLLRGLLTALLSGFLLLPHPSGESMLAWLPGLLYCGAALADFFDGYLARVTRQPTRLGERLDMSFDGLGVLVASFLAVHYGQVPLFYLLVGIARYLFLGMIWLLGRLGRPVYPLPPSPARRPLAGLQMGALAAFLLPIFAAQATSLAATVFAIPFLVSFARDGLVVAGALHPAGRRSDSWKNLERLAPLALRVAAVGLVTAQLVTRGRPDAPGLAALFVAGLLTLGAAGRAAAIGGLALVGLFQAEAGWSRMLAAQVSVFAALLLLGSGPLSLWRPEERWLYRRAGEKAP